MGRDACPLRRSQRGGRKAVPKRHRCLLRVCKGLVRPVWGAPGLTPAHGLEKEGPHLHRLWQLWQQLPPSFWK